MGKDFYESFDIAKQVFETANSVLGKNLTQIIFEDPQKDLKLTKNSQLAIFVVSCAILEVFKHQFPDLKPYVCAGLSLGEYSALYAAQKISFQEALKIVEARGLFMHEASEKYPGSLAVVLGMHFKQIQEILDELNQEVWVANLNCPGQVVISGSLSGLELASRVLKEKGAKRVLPLEVSGAFHSGLMKEAQEKLKSHILQAKLQPSSTRLVMNVCGDFVDDLSDIKNYLIQQVAQPTLWEKGIRKLEEEGIDLYIEMGPGKTLSGMNKKIQVKSPSFNIETIQDLKNIKEDLFRVTAS